MKTHNKWIEVVPPGSVSQEVLNTVFMGLHVLIQEANPESKHTRRVNKERVKDTCCREKRDLVESALELIRRADSQTLRKTGPPGPASEPHSTHG